MKARLLLTAFGVLVLLACGCRSDATPRDRRGDVIAKDTPRAVMCAARDKVWPARSDGVCYTEDAGIAWPYSFPVTYIWPVTTRCDTITRAPWKHVIQPPSGHFVHITFLGVWGEKTRVRVTGLARYGPEPIVFFSRTRWESDRYPIKASQPGMGVKFEVDGDPARTAFTVCSFEAP